MKSISILFLIASLAANAVLAYKYFKPASPNDDAAVATAADAKGAAGGERSRRADRASPSGKAPAAEKIDVAAVVTGGDNAAVVAQLRRAGFPERVILWIMGEKVDEEIFRPRTRAQRDGRDGPLPFWDRRVGSSAETMAAQLATMRERRELLKQLVGTEFWDQQSSGSLNQMLAYLPADKASAVSRIMSDYSDMTLAVRQEMMLAALPEDREKLRLLYEERRADLARVMTPEELQLHELFSSNTAMSLRYELKQFQPTEAEFRAMYDIRRTYDEQSGQLYGYYDMGMEAYEQRQQAQTEMRAKIKAALGEARFAEYERSTDYGYQAASKIVQHYNLPAQAAADVYDLQRAMQQRASELQSNRDESTRGAITALATEATVKLKALLGPEGFEAYRNSGGTWLRTFERGFAPPPTSGGTGTIFLGGG